MSETGFPRIFRFYMLYMRALHGRHTPVFFDTRFGFGLYFCANAQREQRTFGGGTYANNDDAFASLDSSVHKSYEADDDKDKDSACPTLQSYLLTIVVVVVGLEGGLKCCLLQRTNADSVSETQCTISGHQ